MDKYSYQVQKTKAEIMETVLTNTIKMLNARGLIEDEEKSIQALTSKPYDTLQYEISVINNEDKKFYMKFFPQKITAISKTSGISDFLVQHKNKPKLIIVKNINTKAWKAIINQYPKTEVFMEEDLMINLIDHDLVPKHVKLSDEEVDELLTHYNLKLKNIPRILTMDPAVRYYNYKEGDILRIIRASETTAESITYRRVVKGDVVKK